MTPIKFHWRWFLVGIGLGIVVTAVLQWVFP